MNLFLKILTGSIISFFLHGGIGFSDTVLLQNGDKLTGDVKNENFAVQGSFGQIILKKPFCKNITIDDNQIFAGSLETINNDFFSGTILNRQIQILLTNKSLETVSVNDLKSIFFETAGPSRQVITTIFTTGVGDRFSGKLLNPEIRIRTEYMTAIYQAADINRIEFVADKPDNASLLLSNGDLIHGDLRSEKIRIEPDSFAQLTVDQSKLSSIQLKASKMLLKEFSSSTVAEKDSESNRITAAGYGSARNSASNESSAGRALNRRIDFRVIE